MELVELVELVPHQTNMLLDSRGQQKVPADLSGHSMPKFLAYASGSSK